MAGDVMGVPSNLATTLDGRSRSKSTVYCTIVVSYPVKRSYNEAYFLTAVNFLTTHFLLLQ